MKIKAVLFDLGDTLVYQQPFDTFQQILRDNGITTSIDEIREAFEKGNKEFNVDRQAVCPMHEFYTKWNMTVLKHLNIAKKTARKLAEEIDRQWFNYSKVSVYPEVKEALQNLKRKGLKLGIISGGYEFDIEQILSSAGLADWFDVCVGADTAGKRKPEPDVFKHALKQLNVKPEETIFVGDRLEQDYLGAQKVGMKAVLIQREGKPAADVRFITSLNEIFSFL